MKSVEERAAYIRQRISELPAGTLTYKNIRGKRQPYLQWTENGRSRSMYIRLQDREAVFAALEERKKLQKELADLEAASPSLDRYIKPGHGISYAAEASLSESYGGAAAPAYSFNTRVLTGDALKEFVSSVEGWERRDCYAGLSEYINGRPQDRVAVIYGLRRTGKTTLLRQAISDLIPDHIAETAYIKLRRTDSLGSLSLDMDHLASRGIRYFFLDEVTLLPDFIDGAGVLSDIYAARGMKIVLSGTDSLGFWLSAHDELYDRTLMMHTTWIPFREHSRLLGIGDVDEYIRYGGTLRAGTLDFGMSGKSAEEASFRDEESTREYIDTAICRNIQHSLALNEDGRHFAYLQELYEAGELTGAINRIVEDTSHRFLISVLTRPFISHDYRSAADVLRKDRDEDRRSNTLDILDRQRITEILTGILEIRREEELSIGIREEHVRQIEEYLAALDLIAYCPVESLLAGTPDPPELKRVLITQPGMRYCQAQALAYSVMQDPVFRQRPNEEKNRILARILEEVRGRMLEEAVLLETIRSAMLGTDIYHIDNGDGSDIDMLSYDQSTDSCILYEIKHSAKAVPELYRIITDGHYTDEIGRRFGRITGRIVLYRGQAIPVNDDGVEYLNVCDYLKSLGNAYTTGR